MINKPNFTQVIGTTVLILSATFVSPTVASDPKFTYPFTKNFGDYGSIEQFETKYKDKTIIHSTCQVNNESNLIHPNVALDAICKTIDLGRPKTAEDRTSSVLADINTYLKPKELFTVYTSFDRGYPKKSYPKNAWIKYSVVGVVNGDSVLLSGGEVISLNSDSLKFYVNKYPHNLSPSVVIHSVGIGSKVIKPGKNYPMAPITVSLRKTKR